MNETSLPRRFAGALAWPFLHRVRVAILVLLPLGTAFLATFQPTRRRRGSVDWVLALAFALACSVSYLFAVLRRTTDPRGPSPETFGREVDPDEALPDLLGFLGAMLIAYLPLAGLLVHAFFFTPDPLEPAAARIATGAAAVAGTLYFPMTLLMMGVAGDWRAGFNLPLGIRTIGRLGRDYLLCAGAFLATAATVFLVETLLVPSTPARSWPRFLARASGGVAEFYLAIVSMRVLGLLYLARHDRLGWAGRST